MREFCDPAAVRKLQLAVGLLLIAIGGYLALNPLVVAGALDRPHATSTQMINLRASFGGTLAGIGAFIAWLPAGKPYLRALLGLVLWSMAGIGIARVIGFVLDGSPDARQILWISAEALLVAGSGYGLRVVARRAAAK